MIMYIVIHYFCRENGERRIISVNQFRSMTEARANMLNSISGFRDFQKEKTILHDQGGDNWWQIDIRSGYNEFYTWEIVKI